MRILQVTDELPPFLVGGSGRVAWETSVGLTKRGHDVHVLTAAPAGAFPEIAEGVHIHTLPLMPKRFAHYRSVFSKKREREVLSVIDAIKPDVIHIHGVAWHLGYRWILPAAARGIRMIYTAHGVMHMSYGKVLDTYGDLLWIDLSRARWEFNPFRNAYVRKALNRCKALLSVSDALRDFLERHDALGMRTLHNGINVATWRPMLSQQEARTKLSLPLDTTIFLLAGRLGHDKGTDIVDRTLPEAAVLLAAGDIPPNTFPTLGERVHQYPRQSAEQMQLLYAACDVVLVPSLYLDPFPTICLEAMACARPVVATPHGGAKEAVKDGMTGWVIDPYEEEVFADWLQWCVDHRADLPVFGTMGRKVVEEEFSLEKYLDAVITEYTAA